MPVQFNFFEQVSCIHYLMYFSFFFFFSFWCWKWTHSTFMFSEYKLDRFRRWETAEEMGKMRKRQLMMKRVWIIYSRHLFYRKKKKITVSGTKVKELGQWQVKSTQQFSVLKSQIGYRITSWTLGKLSAENCASNLHRPFRKGSI